MFFCSVFVIFEISGKSTLTWGTTFAHGSCMLQVIALQTHEIPAWEKSILLQQIVLLDSEFESKAKEFFNIKFNPWIFMHAFVHRNHL